MSISSKRGLWLLGGTIAGVLIVELVVRFALEVDLHRVLVIETVTFVVAAAVLNSLARRQQGLSERGRKGVFVLSLALILGALRAGLWAAGVDVQWANLTILVVALALFTLWWRGSKRAG